MQLLGSNSTAQIWLHITPDGEKRIVKTSGDTFALEAEAKMLRLLAPHIRVPEVRSLEPGKLVTEYIENDGRCGGSCEEEVAERLAALHAVDAETFGLDFDTTIGPFRQPNAPMRSWIAFYRERRVLDFASKACDEGRIGRTLLRRIEALAGKLEAYLTEPERPALLHGDIWSGNVLADRGRFAALIDPAAYYGHPEVELAFIGMFHTFGERFYRRYAESRPLDEGFFDTRADLYRLFPYLVHVRAYGGSYLGGLEAIVRRFT
jgi:fructosamine-3-kinase